MLHHLHSTTIHFCVQTIILIFETYNGKSSATSNLFQKIPLNHHHQQHQKIKPEKTANSINGHTFYSFRNEIFLAGLSLLTLQTYRRHCNKTLFYLCVFQFFFLSNIFVCMYVYELPQY